MKQPKPWGISLAMNLFECDHNTLMSKPKLKQFIAEIIKEIKMKAHGPCRIDQFGEGSLHGISAMQFIETSSITVHLDDKGDRAFIDIFSCKDFDTKAARDFAKKFYQAKRVTSKTFIR